MTDDGSQKAEDGIRKWECGLRPVGAKGAYAPEGMRKWDLGRLIRRDYGAAGMGDRAWGRDWVCRSQEKEDRGQRTDVR